MGRLSSYLEDPLLRDMYDRVRAAGIDTLDSPTQIVPLVTRDPDPTMEAAASLLKQGYFIQGIRPPSDE